MLSFRPIEATRLKAHRLQWIRVWVRDHKMRELPVSGRTVEAGYGPFTLSQAWRGVGEARRHALEVSYGRDGRETHVARCPAKVYELGPEVPPDDIDGRSPSVVTWHDEEIFYFLASYEMASEQLLQIAAALYK